MFNNGNGGEGGSVLLLSDFGEADLFVTELKQAILAAEPGLKFIDLTHHVPAFDVGHAAYLIEQSLALAEPGAVILAAIDPDQSCPLLAWQSASHFFVGPDNGVFDRVSGSWLRGVQLHSNDGRTGPFRIRDVLAPLAAKLAVGGNLFDLGEGMERPDGWPRHEWSSLQNGQSLMVKVIHIDGFGNVILDQPHRLIHSDRVIASVQDCRFTGLRSRITGPAESRIVLAGSGGYVELCQVQGSAAASTGLKPGDMIRLIGVSNG